MADCTHYQQQGKYFLIGYSDIDALKMDLEAYMEKQKPHENPSGKTMAGRDSGGKKSPWIRFIQGLLSVIEKNKGGVESTTALNLERGRVFHNVR
jgi:hypothetical protein